MACRIRLNKELEKLRGESPENISVEVVDENIFHWRAIIQGPKDTPYENGRFVVDIKFPSEYPFRAPSVHFLTRIYHPNINLKGEICLDILRDKWSSALTVRTLLLSICCLLNEPNPDDPLMAEVANLMRTNKNRYITAAREWTKLYASE